MDFTVLAKGIALAGCAIGAGLCTDRWYRTLVLEKVTQLRRLWKQSDVSLSAEVRLHLPCFLDVLSQRPQVFTVS